MPRYKLTIEYDGSPFAGWQRQADGMSVQAALEAAVVALTGNAATVHGAGRTDAGVHALAQVAHVDLERNWEAGVLRNALNAHLRPHPVSVLSAEKVADTFHARFSATRRSYLYRIITRKAPLALERGRAWWLPIQLDAAAMHAAAQALVGQHDFTTFRAASCQASTPVRTLDRLEVTQLGDLIAIHAEARSFLHHQIRSITGSLKLVGEGKWSAQHLKAALAAANRSSCGPVAPPEGLYLVGVAYDPMSQPTTKLSAN